PPMCASALAQAVSADSQNVQATTLDQQGQIAAQEDSVGCLLDGLERDQQNLPTLIRSCLGNQVELVYDAAGNVVGLRDGLSGILALDSHLGTDPVSVALGDLNNDGITDLVATGRHGSGLLEARLGVFAGNGDGTFVPAADLE